MPRKRKTRTSPFPRFAFLTSSSSSASACDIMCWLQTAIVMQQPPPLVACLRIELSLSSDDIRGVGNGLAVHFF